MMPEELRELIDGLAEVPYGGEAVDERAHALQCAWYALRDGADDDLVLAALLHDAGRAVDPGIDHERSGEELGRRLVGERAGWLIGSHAQAKRYLVAVEPEYAGTLSPASAASLRVQGGPMTPTEAARFAAHPWAADAVRLRRWDDLAKVPRGPEADLDDLVERYRRRTAPTSG
jgi:gamma-butyrobetaine dioxygenase